MSEIDWTLVIALVALIMSCITAATGIAALSLVIGLKNSTHKIQWMEVPRNEDGSYENPTGDELIKEFKNKMYPELENEYV